MSPFSRPRFKKHPNSMFVDVGGSSSSPNNQGALENVSLRWMIKEVLLAQPGLIFRQDETRLDDLGIIITPTSSHDPSKEIRGDPDGASPESTPSSTAASPAVSPSREVPRSPYSQPRPTLQQTTQSKSQILNPPSVIEPASSPSPYLPIDARPEDVRCAINDHARNPVWWLLEFIPMITAWQDGRDRWHNRLR